VKDVLFSRKKKTRQLLGRSIPVIVLVTGLVLLLTHFKGPEGETTVPVKSQVAENSDTGPALQNPTDRLPPGAQTKLEVTLNPDAIENNAQQQAPVDPSTSSAAPPVTEEPLPEEGGRFSISGLVVDEAGRGVAGIEVAAFLKNPFPADEDSPARKNERERNILTDFEGYYEFRGVDDGEYRIGTQPNDFYEAAQAVVRAGAETADLVVRERRPDVGVYGTVRSDEGPLDNVQVQVIGQSSGAVLTDGEGFYELDVEVSRSKPAYTLRFVRDGYREKRPVIKTQEMAGPGQIRVDAELEPVQELVEVSGTVLSNKGKPIPGETVQLYSESTRQRHSAVSDRNGAFWVDEVETSSDYLLSVRPRDKWRDFVTHGVEIALGGADLEVVLEPLNLGSLTGQMVDPNGQPVPEFSLWLRNPDAINQPHLLVTGDQQGYFRVDEIEAGALIFETRSSPLYRISGIHLSAGEKKEISLVLDWGNNQVMGLVVDDAGRPVTASELFVNSFRRYNGVRAHAVRRAITDEAGFFLFTRVGPGYHTIRIDVPGFGTTILDHDVGMDTPEVIVRLEPASSHGM